MITKEQLEIFMELQNGRPETERRRPDIMLRDLKDSGLNYAELRRYEQWTGEGVKYNLPIGFLSRPPGGDWEFKPRLMKRPTN